MKQSALYLGAPEMHPRFSQGFWVHHKCIPDSPKRFAWILARQATGKARATDMLGDAWTQSAASEKQDNPHSQTHVHPTQFLRSHKDHIPSCKIVHVPCGKCGAVNQAVRSLMVDV